MRCKDGSVLLLIRQRNGILSVRFQPLVYLIKVDDPSLAWLGAGDFPVREFLIDGRKGDVGVLGNLLWRDRAVSVLSLLSWSVRRLSSNAFMPDTSSRSSAMTCGRSLNVSGSLLIYIHDPLVESCCKGTPLRIGGQATF